MSVRIGIACAMGGFLGALIAFASGTLWPLGLLVGGVIGAFTQDQAHFRKGARLGWEETVRAACTTVQFLNTCGDIVKSVVADRTWQQLFLYFWGTSCSLITLVFSWLIAILIVLIPLTNSTDTSLFSFLTDFGGVYALFLVGAFFIIGATTFFEARGLLTKSPEARYKEIVQEQEIFQVIVKALQYGNPFVALPYVLWKTGAWICSMAYAFYRGIRVAFIYIHTDIASLCFVDSALGAAFGFLIASAESHIGYTLLGGVAGAAFGVLNYEIVSKRWLKLVPR